MLTRPCTRSPSAQAERHLLLGNVFWTILFGWWLAAVCIVLSALLYYVPNGGRQYSSLVFGLGWYLFWPFGKYVEGDTDEEEDTAADEETPIDRRSSNASDAPTLRPSAPEANGNTPSAFHAQSMSWNPLPMPGERTTLLTSASRSYGVAPQRHPSDSSNGSIARAKEIQAKDWLGKACFWIAFVCIIAPLILIVCLLCWALVVTIPMAKLNWALIKHIFYQPKSIRFCAAPKVLIVPNNASSLSEAVNDEEASATLSQLTVKQPRLAAGQAAPYGSSTVLLCTYRAMGWKYYKYTVGGVNILFVNLIPVVFFVIFCGWVIMPLVERKEHRGEHVPALLAFLGSQSLIFFMSLLSVIPLSYFIGMAVASISAQSSIGMGAVINATFGSIIEIILYGIALAEGKGHLVEGSIVGSLLAGVLLMPGASMCCSAIRRKEQKFNAKSAGVTSMMLIMAIIGALAPTLFYQTYGNFQLHPDPVEDPFYQSTVKSLMYFCATILLFSYLIGLWFSLRTHATQIWQNPQPLMHAMDLPTHNRLSIYQKLLPGHGDARPPLLNHKSSTGTNLGSEVPSRSQTPVPREYAQASTSTVRSPGHSPVARRVSYAPPPPVITTSQQFGLNPVLETVGQTVKDTGLAPTHLPENMTTEDFTRAVAVATVSALRHQQTAQSPARLRSSMEEGAGDAHGGHDAPSWSRTTSASVLLACTALYAIIAELLVDVVDVILQGSGIDEKFLGVTLFALVPNTTEFMNAMSFALNGNIALSMEIGSAYALQVCLLQIPAMVAFSAWYYPEKMGEIAYTFTLIFPRWDVIALILSMFLMTYTYIEAKSNYHRGSILILSYLVLVAGFYFAPPAIDNEEGISLFNQAKTIFSEPQTFWSSIRMFFKTL
ncbi:hypothetical protein ONZ45_g16052 [Pleurotus djamor]|nr:hypothetical protein ONZ45_g16052 [Pleurotus djamor]